MRKISSPKKILIVSLGCAKNLVDTEVICGKLATAGFMLTNDADSADIMLINTCSFVRDARQESDDAILDAQRWKRKGRGRMVVVAGCLPQLDLKAVRQKYSKVDLFLGLDDVDLAAERLKECLTTGRSGPDTEQFPESRYLYDAETPRLQLTPRSYAYVKIAEGCDHRCRFCTIPSIRGHQRSRPVANIVRECRQLLDMGVMELNFIGQDTTRYGTDLKDGTDLETLFRSCDELEGDFWIRLMYTHPRYLTRSLLRCMAASKHVVPYLDIPLQHISDHILEDMGRRIGEEETRQLMADVRTLVPGITVRTTFMVGFPGETEEDFRKLYDFIKAYRFERLGVFVFSPEAGTPAGQITEGLVPLEVAEDRQRQLLELQQEISLEHNRSLIGQTLPVLADDFADRRTLVGRLMSDAPEIDNLVHFAGDEAVLDRGFNQVRITDATAYDLQGELVPAEEG
jgi:ribosomal protein S12 methylthiotransferase